jgi:hypothetical protein
VLHLLPCEWRVRQKEKRPTTGTIAAQFQQTFRRNSDKTSGHRAGGANATSTSPFILLIALASRRHAWKHALTLAPIRAEAEIR